MAELYCGDCLEVMRTLDENSVDMILCDLPYGCTRNEWDKKLPFDELWEQYHRVLKERGVVALFGKQKFTAEVMVSNFKQLRYKITWKKTCGTDFLNANRKPLSCHEDICIFYAKQPVYNPQMRTGFKPYTCDRSKSGQTRLTSNFGSFVSNNITKNDSGLRYPIDVIEFPYAQKKGHSTAKPVRVLEWLINTYTNKGMTVLDNCMGSGSTGVACINTCRHFIGIEKERKFFNIASERIHEAELQRTHSLEEF